MNVVTGVGIAAGPEPVDEALPLLVASEIAPHLTLFVEHEVLDRTFGPAIDVGLEVRHRLLRIFLHLRS